MGGYNGTMKMYHGYNGTVDTTGRNNVWPHEEIYNACIYLSYLQGEYIIRSHVHKTITVEFTKRAMAYNFQSWSFDVWKFDDT